MEFWKIGWTLLDSEKDVNDVFPSFTIGFSIFFFSLIQRVTKKQYGIQKKKKYKKKNNNDFILCTLTKPTMDHKINIILNIH